MDTQTYDLGKLDFEEMLALRDLQGRAGGEFDLARLTLDELKQLERLYYKMAGKEYPWDHPVYKTGYCDVVTPAVQPADSKPAPEPSKPVEPAAIAQAPAPAKPAAPATPTPAETRPEPADGVLSAHHQLDALMRFGA